MKTLFLYGIVSLLGILNCYPQDSGTIRGKVTDANGVPLIGANVIIESLSLGVVTDNSGNYIFSDLADGDYSLKVTYIGFETRTATITVGGVGTQQDFVLVESSVQLEGLVVTAQKREQRNKEVPIAITSYGSEFINNNNTFEYDAFSEYVPGLQVQIQSVNNPGIVVRGITSDNGDSRIEPRVSVFQDGVSISKSRGSVVELFDLERIEVLKGPQGTLFGRSAQIGAMHIIQNKAKNETSGSLRIGYGDFNQTLLNGHYNLPLVKDKLFLRVAGIYNARDGFIENNSGGDLNGKETLAFRGSLRYLFSNKTFFDLIVNWQKDTPPGTSFKSGTFAPINGDVDPNSFADLERGEELSLDRDVYGITGILKHNINEMWDFTSITAFREFDSNEAFDADGTAAPVLFFREIAKGKQFSQEVRFNFDNNKRFRGFFGANFFYEDGSQSVPFEVNEQSLGVLLLDPGNLVVNGVPVLLPNIPDDPETFGPLAGAPLLPFNREVFTNFGENYSGDIFADASVDVTNQLTVTLGLRGTLENINAGFEAEDAEQPGVLGNFLGVFPNNLFASTNGERINASDNFTSVVGRLAADFDVSDEVTLFGSVSRGRRPNVINVTATEVDVLSAETVWSYEIGGKSLFMNNRLQLDLNAFFYDYNNFQTNIATVDAEGGVDFNPDDSGSASAFGAEFAFQYAFGKKSTVFANYAYIDATFDDTDENGNPQELAGNRFRLTPEHSFSLGLNLNPQLNSTTDLFFRPTYTYKSEVFFEETNLPGISQEGYGLLNIRAGLIFNKKYEFNVYVTNLLDESFIIDAGNTGGAFGIPTFIAGPPRFFGGQVAVRF